VDSVSDMSCDEVASVPEMLIIDNNELTEDPPVPTPDVAVAAEVTVTGTAMIVVLGSDAAAIRSWEKTMAMVIINGLI
jgi:hypothetical protein